MGARGRRFDSCHSDESWWLHTGNHQDLSSCALEGVLGKSFENREIGNSHTRHHYRVSR